MTNSDAIRVPRDIEGFLIKPQDWNITIGRVVAAVRGIELHTFRSIACLADQHRWDRKQAGKRGLGLLHRGYLKQVGMMRPRAWSTG